jgi:hypothetical protein
MGIGRQARTLMRVRPSCRKSSPYGLREKASGRCWVSAQGVASPRHRSALRRGCRSEVQVGYGIQPGRDPRRFGVVVTYCAKGFGPRAFWQNHPFATRTSADRTRILAAPRTHTGRMESLAYAQNWRIICPGRLECQPLIGAVRLFGVVLGWMAGGTEVQTEERRKG